MPEHFLLFVVEHDAQNLIIDHALGLLRSETQQLFDVQDRARFAADFVQQQQCVRLRANLLEQSRVFHRDGQPAGQQR